MPSSEKNSTKYGSSGCWKGPVAYTAPGVFWGGSTAFSAIGGVGVGSEEVFDFANMKSQWFNVNTYGLTGTAGLTFMNYYGVILGLNNADTTANVYSGPSHFVSVGAGLGEVVSINVGWTISRSTTRPELITMSQYYSGGIGVDFIPGLDVSFGVSDAEPSGNPNSIGEDLGPKLRQLAGNFLNLSKFMNYAYIHEEIYADSQ
jgi:hypothetical protein